MSSLIYRFFALLEWLQDLGYELGPLRNIDFVDAALCAHVALCYVANDWHSFGDSKEGFIVVPAMRGLMMPLAAGPSRGLLAMEE